MLSDGLSLTSSVMEVFKSVRLGTICRQGKKVAESRGEIGGRVQPSEKRFYLRGGKEGSQGVMG